MTIETNYCSTPSAIPRRARSSSGPTGGAQPASGLAVTDVSGSCDSGSPDDPGRAAAYRCTASNGDVVLGPCFADTAAGDPGAPVLCSTDPTSKQIVRLSLGTTTLPSQPVNADDPAAPPWFLVLADGRSCHFAGTGTNSDILAYDCGDGIGATLVDRSQPLWTVHEGSFRQASPKPAAASVGVVTAYR